MKSTAHESQHEPLNVLLLHLSTETLLHKVLMHPHPHLYQTKADQERADHRVNEREWAAVFSTANEEGERLADRHPKEEALSGDFEARVLVPVGERGEEAMETEVGRPERRSCQNIERVEVQRGTHCEVEREEQLEETKRKDVSASGARQVAGREGVLDEVDQREEHDLRRSDDKHEGCQDAGDELGAWVADLSLVVGALLVAGEDGDWESQEGTAEGFDGEDVLNVDNFSEIFPDFALFVFDNYKIRAQE